MSEHSRLHCGGGDNGVLRQVRAVLLRAGLERGVLLAFVILVVPVRVGITIPLREPAGRLGWGLVPTNSLHNAVNLLERLGGRAGEDLVVAVLANKHIGFEEFLKVWQKA